MRKGEIDMYVDYTGTVFMNILGHDAETDMDLVYETCKKELKEKYDIDVLKQAQLNNTYTLAMYPK